MPADVRHPVSPWNWFAGRPSGDRLPRKTRIISTPIWKRPCSPSRNGTACSRDGLVGKNTLAALNESAAHKANRIALNLERIRWLPAEPDRSLHQGQHPLLPPGYDGPRAIRFCP